jgi:hypothetical protein
MNSIFANKLLLLPFLDLKTNTNTLVDEAAEGATKKEDT